MGKGLSLYDIGMCMTTHDDIPFNMSRLQRCVNQAIIAVLLNELSEKTKKKCISSGRSRSPILPAVHTVNDHNLGAALKVNDGITLLDEIFQSVEIVVDTYKSDCHF